MKWMKIFFCIGFFILIFATPKLIYGNNKLSPGYVITSSNDTLYGFIEYRNKRVTPDHIIFKRTTGDAGQIYFPKSLKEFRADDIIFRSAVLKIDQSSRKKSQLISSPVFQFITDTVFLQAIILGDKELYFSSDSSSNDNFFIKKDSNYIWLMHKSYLKTEDNRQVVATNNYYIGQLIGYLKNCPTINPVISEGTYTYKSLLKSFLYYYGCTGTEPEYRLDEEKMNAIQRFFAK